MRSIVFAAILVMTAPRLGVADESRVESYQKTVAVLDGVAFGLAVPGVIGIYRGEGGTRTFAIVATSVGGALYLFGVPITHGVKQDKRDKYYGSLLMRVLVPGLLGGAGAKLGESRCSDPENCNATLVGFLIGAGIGAVASSAVDITLLAKRRVVVAPSNGGVLVGVAGRF